MEFERCPPFAKVRPRTRARIETYKPSRWDRKRKCSPSHEGAGLKPNHVVAVDGKMTFALARGRGSKPAAFGELLAHPLVRPRTRARIETSCRDPNNRDCPFALARGRGLKLRDVERGAQLGQCSPSHEGAGLKRYKTRATGCANVFALARGRRIETEIQTAGCVRGDVRPRTRAQIETHVALGTTTAEIVRPRTRARIETLLVHTE